MKVLHILDTVNRAGAEILVLDICRNAADSGFDVAFAALGRGELEGEFANLPIPTFRFERKYPIDLRVVMGLRRVIKDQRVDIVHSHQAVDALHAYLATAGTGVKRVLTFHGHFSDRKNRTALRYLVPRVDANLVCSNGLRSWVDEQGIDTSGFKVVYNGVDRRRLDYDGPGLKEELGIPVDSTVFGMIAHFHPEPRKDQLTLCRAFANAARSVSDPHVVLAGKPVGKAGQHKLDQCRRVCIDAGVSDRVHVLGHRTDIPKLVSGIDIHVFSSLHEGLPIALMEAMLAERPTILSDIPPHVEVSNNGEFALLFETQDPDDLSGKMVQLASDHELRSRLAEKASIYAKEAFTIERHLCELRSVYEQILGAK